MYISKLQLQNFKRFTDLTIDLRQEQSPPKLVLLIGTNGCGKSSIFDAFEYLSRTSIRGNSLSDGTYYKKIQDQELNLLIEFTNGKSFIKTNTNHLRDDLLKKFYGRSSLRIIPKIQQGGNLQDLENNTDGPEQYIGYDVRFTNDLEYFINKLFQELAKPVFQGKNANTVQIFQKLIEPLNTAFKNIFSDNESIAIQIEKFEPRNQNHPAQLFFRKGLSVISYNLLSHGEKQIVIMLLNFAVRKEMMQDYIYYIDEMDVHLNTALQFNVLQEVVQNRLPSGSQLRTATHALGFIEFARDSQESVIIDFDHYDFDETKVLLPIDKNDPDKSYFNIALTPSVLNLLIKSNAQTTIISEGNNKDILKQAMTLYGGNKSFEFLDGGGKNQLKIIFEILSQNNFDRYKMYFVFDCDASAEYTICKAKETSHLKVFLLSQNKTNGIIKKGIENMFPQYLFEKNYVDRSVYYSVKNKTSDYGEAVQNEQFDKSKFQEYIIGKNDKNDFIFFEDIIRGIIS